MIKRFRFGTANRLPPAPPDIRPLRVTLSTPVDESTSLYSYSVQWFADDDVLTRYELWEAATADRTTVIIADEVVQRGADWLAQRWSDGGNKCKHVALARRAPQLSQAEFSRRWRNHAGRATTKAAASTPIPEAARGLAYVQNHPLLGVDWRFDAITEVWFDDLASMQPRLDWFRDNVAADDLFVETTFLAVVEEVLSPSMHAVDARATVSATLDCGK